MGRILPSLAALVCAAVIVTAAQQAAPTLPPLQGPPPESLPVPVIAFEPVKPIEPPAHPLPPEADTARITKFSFIVYGDTRSGAVGDGDIVHPIHSQVVTAMLAAIKTQQRTPYPVRFVLQTGDAVLIGAAGRMWNVSFTPIIERLTKRADIPYFLTAGNHDVALAAPGDPVRQLGLNNTLAAVSKLIPSEGSPRRLNGYAAYGFGYGNVFVIALDTTIAADPLQLAWATDQLERLDRTRFRHVFAFVHYPPFSSGPHGGPILEPQTEALRDLYMPLFRKHHVRMILGGHEHLYEHWVERYTDDGHDYRIDAIVTGGGGAPTYTYRGEPDLTAYLAAGAAQNVRVEHLVKPGTASPDNPNHFVIITVDGDKLSAQVIAPNDAAYAPFNGRARIDLSDGGS